MINRPAPSSRTRGGGVACVLVALAFSLIPGAAHAGPPYLTDDPDPVAYHHWELYLASQWDHIGAHSAQASLPHVEVNFGVVDGVMFHSLVPAAFATSSGQDNAYGMGDVELGANIRILAEGPVRPQVGTFPIVTIPTGSEARGLGSGTTEVFLPIWLMKHVGAWTLDGGGGVSFAGADAEGAFGAFVERSFGDVLSIGAENFATVPFDGSPARNQIDLALILNLSDTHHLLFSGGPSFGSVHGGQAYASWLVTL